MNIRERYRPIPFKTAFACLLATVCLAGFFSTHSYGQVPEEIPEGVVPPPLRYLTKDETEKLDGEKKLSDRTKLSLEFMEARIASSETFAEGEKFEEALMELGRFHGLMSNTLSYLKRNEYEKGSLKNFKRFEIALREFIPRLEVVRRALPFKYSYHVSRLIKSVREVRRKSIEPFYSDTVLPDGI